MADNGDLNYQVDADVRQASAKLEQLKSQINGVTANLIQSQNTIAAAMTKMTGDINASISKAKAGSDQLLALQRRLGRVEGNTLSSLSRGQVNEGNRVAGNQVTGAAGQQIINEARNSAKSVTARIQNELINQFTQELRTMDRAIDARLRQAMASSDRMLANSAPDVMTARTTLNQRNNQNAIRRAEMGDARFGMSNTLERIGSNGGADIISVQARLLAGYQALNLAMSGLSNTAQFVVGLDAEFRQFQAITATTNFEMITLKDNLIGVSEASKFTALEIAQAATTMGQAGLSAKEVGETIGSVAELATAAGSSLAESVDVVTSTMSIFNLQTSQAADVANTLTAALNLSKLSMDKLVLGFQYAGNTAAQMGVTYQELTGVLGALSNSGIRSGSTLGTGLRQLLIDIQNPSTALTKTLKELGLTQEDINVESNGLINVLQTLKDNGFGAAQAFETLEVRAAAAYAALSNNTDLAVELQQQFILSSAAAEANAVQMESLANTYAKFQSVVGTVAYNAFEPLVEVLQDVINGFADFLAQLNQYPEILNVLAVAFSGLATYVTLFSASALFRGLLGAIPMFGTLTTAVGGTATAIGVLNAVMRANPFILLASVLAGGAVAMAAFGNDAITAADKVDILKGQLNALNGEADETSGQIDAINQTISNLIKQKAALDSDPLMRTAKILEVKQAFREIAGEVDTTTGTVEELIAALTRLATTDYSKLGSSIRATVAGNEALIAGYQNVYADNASRAGQPLYNQINNFRQMDSGFVQSGTEGIGGSRGLFGGDFTPDARDRAEYESRIQSFFSDNIGEMFGEFAAMAFDPSKMPETFEGSQQVIDRISQREGEYNTQLFQLQGNAARGEPLSAEEQEALDNIPVYLEMLAALKMGLKPLADTQLNIASTQSSIDLLRNEQINADAGVLLSKDGGINAQIQALEGEITQRFSDIRRNGATLGIEGQMKAYEELDAEFKARVEEITASTETIAQELAQSGGYGIDESRNAVGSATNRLASLQAQVSTANKGANVNYQELLEEQLEIDIKEIDDEIALQLSGRTRALTENSLDQIEDYIRAKFDQKREVTEALFGAQIAQEEDDDAKGQLERELRAQQREINRAEQEALLKIGDDRKDLQVDVLQEQKDAIDSDIKIMQGKLQELVTQISKASPGPVMDALIAQWQSVATAQQGLLDTSNGLGIQLGSLSTGAKPITGTQSTRANDAMKIMMSLGYSQEQAAGIIGNLMAESSMNPNAIGDGGKAYGLGQWHPDRQKLLQQFAEQRGMDGTQSETQLRFIDWEMKNSPSTAGANTLDQLRAQTTAAGAADVFRRLYERPSADPIKGAHDARIGYARTLAGQEYNVEAAAANDNRTDLNTAVETGTVKGIKQQSAAAVTAATQQIQTLMTQAGITSNPATIKGMISTVDTLYNNIIEERTKAFDAENKTALDAGDADVLAQRENLIEGLKADQNQKMSSMLETYWKALDDKIQEPLEQAQLALDEAQKPENVGKYTQADILGLENNVRIAERKVLVDQLNAAQEILAQSSERVNEAEPGSAEHNYWLLEQARALEVVNALTQQKNTADSVTAQQGPSVASAISSATQAWAMQNGVLDELGNQIPLAKQVENAWGGVLDTLTTGFSTLFVDLAKGTMTAEEAFKKFALSVIDSFMQMIAKALAMQVVMALMGGEGGGGAGDWIGNLLGVVAPTANGHIKGAAFGEVIGGFSNRDSELRRVMPGEVILRRSAVGAIGADALAKINDLGSRSVSEGPSPVMPANDNPASPGMLNVWVVTPDQVPPMGPQDVIATVADNIQRRGSIKQLIQQVQMGG